MRRSITLPMLLMLALATVTGAYAHGGKSHRLLGTVQEVHEDHVTLTTRDGHEREILLTAETEYEKGGKPAERADLAAGVRVVVELDEQDKTALRIKIGESRPR